MCRKQIVDKKEKQNPEQSHTNDQKYIAIEQEIQTGRYYDKKRAESRNHGDNSSDASPQKSIWNAKEIKCYCDQNQTDQSDKKRSSYDRGDHPRGRTNDLSILFLFKWA